MRIEEIKPSQRKKGRILVKLSDGAILRLTEETASALSVGMELDEGELAALEQAAAMGTVKNQAVELVGRRALSRRELEQRLLQKGGDAAAVAETADWLEEIGALDDGNYAEVVARHYARRGYGAGRVRQELQRRGIPREHWDIALEQLPDSGDAIRSYIQKKCGGDLEDPGVKKRVCDGLLRRGFSWSEIRAAISGYTDLGEEDLP